MAHQSSDTQNNGHFMRPAQEQAIRSFLLALGVDLTDPNLTDTPKRVAKAWNEELLAGYRHRPEDVLKTTFPGERYDEMVICKDIEIYSMCSHHLLPFYGKAHVGYIPRKDVVGLSKLARLVDIFARRLQLQERLTKQVLDALTEHLKPRGAMVVIEAKHMCMCSRGVSKQNSVMVTSAVYGAMKKHEVRNEFMELIK